MIQNMTQIICSFFVMDSLMVIACVGRLLDTFFNELIKMAEKGYIAKNDIKEEKTLIHRLYPVLIFIPIINFLATFYCCKQLQEDFNNNEKFKSQFEKMSASEKSKFKDAKTRQEKLQLIAKCNEPLNQEKTAQYNKKTTFKDGNLVRPVRKLISIRTKPLKKRYLINDIKVLNNSLNSVSDDYKTKYIIGTIDDTPSAIIGLPNNGEKIERVFFKNKNNIYPYVHMTEEEAKDVEFDVYTYYQEQYNKLQMHNEEEKTKTLNYTPNKNIHKEQ